MGASKAQAKEAREKLERCDRLREGERRSDIIFSMSLDHAVPTSLGRQLAQCRASSLVGTLGLGEKRHCREGMRPIEQRPCKRCCIERAIAQTRWDVPCLHGLDGIHVRKAIHMCSVSCSNGTPFYMCVGLQGTRHLFPWYIPFLQDNACAESEAGLSVLKLDLRAVNKMQQWPYTVCGRNHDPLTECVKELPIVHTCRCL